MRRHSSLRAAGPLRNDATLTPVVLGQAEPDPRMTGVMPTAHDLGLSRPPSGFASLNHLPLVGRAIAFETTARNRLPLSLVERGQGVWGMPRPCILADRPLFDPGPTPPNP